MLSCLLWCQKLGYLQSFVGHFGRKYAMQVTVNFYLFLLYPMASSFQDYVFLSLHLPLFSLALGNHMGPRALSSASPHTYAQVLLGPEHPATPRFEFRHPGLPISGLMLRQESGF